MRIIVCANPRRLLLLGACAAGLLLPGGCKTVAPSNARAWSPDQGTLAYAEQAANLVTIHNVRNCKYLADEEYVLDYYDKTYNLDDLQTVDFVMIPFPDMPSIAHTMLSFGFGENNYLVLSVEIRKEEGEQYAAWKGGLRQYELMYVLGDEQDLIKLRTNYRGDNVYLYHANATPAQARALFLDVIARVNKLRDDPEFYDTLTNNCTTNIVRHINTITPNRVPYDLRVILPGYSDRLAYDLGLLQSAGSFEETKRRAKITEVALLNGDAEDFSKKIRGSAEFGVRSAELSRPRTRHSAFRTAH